MVLDPEQSCFKNGFGDALDVKMDLAGILEAGVFYDEGVSVAGFLECDLGLRIFGEDRLGVMFFQRCFHLGKLLVCVGCGWVDAVLVVADCDFHFIFGLVFVVALVASIWD